MLYKFIDNKGTFIVKSPHKYNAYFPLTNKDGSLLSSISPNLGGDIKQDNRHFLTPPASIEDARNNLLCRRDFFIKQGKEIIRLSRPYNDTLQAGLLYHKLIKETDCLRIEVINFIPYNMAVEIMWVKITNISVNPIKIAATSFIPLYGRGEKELRDHRHVSSLLNRVTLNKYGVFLKPTMLFNEEGHVLNDTTYFALGFEGNSAVPAGQFPTLDYFCGEGDLITPDAIYKTIKPARMKNNAFDGKECCAAFRFRNKPLKKNQSADYFVILGITKKERAIAGSFHKLNSVNKVKKSLQDTQKYWFSHFSKLEFDFGDANFTNWLRWVKVQPTLRKLFGCSFLPHFDYGKGGRGWRDLWQDALTLLLTEPDKAKDLILASFQGVRIDGSNATIITKDAGFISDRNRISRVWCDHGVWPFITLRSYINRSGEISLLLKEIPYFKDRLLYRAKKVDTNFSQKDFRLTTEGGLLYNGSVLEHLLIQNLTSFFNVGRHNIIKLENADWNDGLDMAAQNGESVTFSFMYAHNLSGLCRLLEELAKKTKTVSILSELTLLLDRLNTPVNYDDYREKQNRLEQYFSKTERIRGEKVNISISGLIYDLTEKAKHLSLWLKEKEWQDKNFFNGYYDNDGIKSEGLIKGKIRMMLAPQVFAIMSGGLDNGYIEKMWASIKTYLKDAKTGGFCLNTDFGGHYMALGRAFGFAYGDKENGAFFNHMVIMLGFSLYKSGFIKEGAQVLNSIYKMATAPEAGIYPMIPEYFNRQGRGLYLYLTGSGSWYIYTLLEEVLGIKFDMGNFIIAPKLVSSNFFQNEISLSFYLGGKKVNLSFRKPAKSPLELKMHRVLLEKEKLIINDSQCIINKEYIVAAKGKEINIKVHLE